MKSILLGSLALASAAAATGAHQHYKREEAGAQDNSMTSVMKLKSENFEQKLADGAFGDGKYKAMGQTPCQDGKAGEYDCSGIDVEAFVPHGDLGSGTRAGNDIWGWTSDDGREFALVGQTDGTAFAEILKDGQGVRYVGRLPTQTETSIWRDIKVIGSHASIGSEAADHGLQVFDLRRLLDAQANTTFDLSKDLTAHYTGFGSSHNVVADEETNTIFVVGAKRDAACAGSNGGLIMLDVKDPSQPSLLGCVGDDGYVHDAQCMVYHGVDKAYDGHHICFAFDETKLAVMDVTDKQKPAVLSRTFYDGFAGIGAYTHQGWTIDEGMRYLVLDDELDEKRRGEVGGDTHTTTYIFDMANLTLPRWTGQYKSPVKSIDHNQYVVDHKRAFQANYASGLRVVDVSGVPEDPTGGNMRELAHFDCYPEDDADPKAEFNGAWSVYPWFKSGTVVVNCIERGLFALKVTAGGY